MVDVPSERRSALQSKAGLLGGNSEKQHGKQNTRGATYVRKRAERFRGNQKSRVAAHLTFNLLCGLGPEKRDLKLRH